MNQPSSDSRADLRLVVGLGNPGPRYRGHRHNLGFRVVEELARRRGLVFADEDVRYRSTGPADGDGLVLLEPLTFMNLSGEALTAWSRRHGRPLGGGPDPVPAAAPETAEPAPSGPAFLRPLVVCDDLALPLGSLRLRPGGGSGGQNGLASILDRLGGEEVPRLRLGIAPLDREVAPEDWADYVLADFEPAETEAAEQMVRLAADAVLCWLAEGLEAAAARCNRRIRRPGA